MSVNLKPTKLQPKGLEGGALWETIKLGVDLPNGSERSVEITINGKVVKSHVKPIQFGMSKDIKRPTCVGKLMGQVDMYGNHKLMKQVDM